MPRGIVTSTNRPRPEQMDLARALATQTGLALTPYHRSISRTLEAHQADFALVVEREGLKVVHRSGAVLRHHPGMAIYRVGCAQPHPFLGCLRPRWGDSTLDTTLGFGRDALLVADRTDRPVLGFERHPVMAVLTALGLRRLAGIRRFRRAAPRVHTIRGDGFRALASFGRERFDLILVDPLFPSPVKGAADMAFLHELSEPEPFDVEILRLAASVARRRVLLRWPRSRTLPTVGLDQVVRSFHGRYLYVTLDLSRRATRRRLRRR